MTPPDDQLKLSAADIGQLIAVLTPLLSLIGAGILRVIKYLIDQSKDFLENHITKQNAAVEMKIRELKEEDQKIMQNIEQMQRKMDVSLQSDTNVRNGIRQMLDDFRAELLKEVNEQTKKEIEPIKTQVFWINDFMAKVKASAANKKGSGQ